MTTKKQEKPPKGAQAKAEETADREAAEEAVAEAVERIAEAKALARDVLSDASVSAIMTVAELLDGLEGDEAALGEELVLARSGAKVAFDCEEPTAEQVFAVHALAFLGDEDDE